MLTEDLAQYVLALEDAAASATRVADRPAYEKYRAHAGLLLALALTDKDGARLREHLEAHDRLWLQTVLVDKAYKAPSAAWQKVRETARL